MAHLHPEGGRAVSPARASTLIEKHPPALKETDPPSAQWMTAGVGWLRARQAAVVVRFPKKPDHDGRPKGGSESAGGGTLDRRTRGAWTAGHATGRCDDAQVVELRLDQGLPSSACHCTKFRLGLSERGILVDAYRCLATPADHR